MVPNGWKKYPLSDLLKSSNQGINTTTEKVEYSESGIPAIRSNNVSEGRFDLSDKKFVTEEEYSRFSKKFKPEFGDILYCNIGSNLGSACVNFEKHPFLITWNVFRAVPNQNVLLPQFGALLLNWNRRDLRRFATESTMPFISSKELLKYKFTIPPLPEQRKIAQILSTWDRGIATTEKLIDASKQQKKALMQQLLTGKKRLINPETGKAFEEEWEEVKLGDVCIVNPKKANEPKNGLVSFIPMDAVSEDAKLLRNEVKQYSEVAKGFTAFIDGDVLVAKITPCFENGKGAQVFGLENGIGFGSTEFHVLRAKKNICSQFIYFITNTSGFRIRGEMNMQGSAGQKRVTTDYLKLYKMTIPKELAEQQKIASVLTAADKEIELLEAKLAHFKQEKKALMQQLLTGKRRVNIAEIKVATEETLEVEVA